MTIARSLFAAIALLLATAAAAWTAVPLPDVVTSAYPGLKPLGDARLRVFGFHIYDSSLWVSGSGYRANELFALDIRYARNFKGEWLAEQSVDEWRRMGIGDEKKYKRWYAEMAKVFPDVKPDDRIIGVSVPGKEVRFYSASGLLGVIEDGEFAQAFFAIWLDPRTREPAVREKLLSGR